MTRLERLRVYPVKGLDGVDVDAARTLDGGTLAHDREFALLHSSGKVLNGKRTDRVHDLRTDFGPETGAFVVETPAGETERFVLPDDRERAETWFSEFFEVDLTLERDDSRGFVDRREMGLSVLSTGSVEEIASWFEGMTPESGRRRMRANVEVSGVPAFWEDRFVSDEAPRFEIGSVEFEGLDSCGRCIVPARDPETGTETPGFRERFVEQRAETFPEWADPAAFDHHYAAMILARVVEGDNGSESGIGFPFWNDGSAPAVAIAVRAPE
ncbi:MAG: MOSC domain-containing protein [Halobellus sp.]|uniref:MOSC domain-containing protein n=1 Tax=Halobellus sp. TaxID=1979212 RepID=UPI0035D4A7AB